MPDQLNAKCACGAVRATLRGPFHPGVACHCESCRRQSGHYVVATRIPREHLTIETDATLKWWQATDHAARGHCTECGSLMFWQHDQAETVSVFLGCIDGPTGLSISEHIHLEEKGDYYDI